MLWKRTKFLNKIVYQPNVFSILPDLWDCEAHFCNKHCMFLFSLTITFFLSIGRWSLCNLWFADNNDLIAGTELEFPDLSTRLEKISRSYRMEITTEKARHKWIAKRNMGQPVSTKTGHALEEGNTFEYLVSIICSDSSSTKEIKPWKEMALSTMTRLNRFGKVTSDNLICFNLEVQAWYCQEAKV